MAISQAKIKELLVLARNLIAVFEAQEHRLRHTLVALDDGTITHDGLVAVCRDLCGPMTGAGTALLARLDREEQHYEMTHRKNEAERRRKYRLRHPKAADDDRAFEPISSEELAKILGRETGEQ